MNYKPLETEFNKNQFRFRQIRREGDFAIFHKVAIPGGVHPVAFDGGFETIVITRHDGYIIGGIEVEPAEVYPSSEQFGVKGWYYPTLFAAEQKFERLCGRLPEVKKNVVETPPVDLSEPAKPRRPRGEEITLTIPVQSFTINELATFNNTDYNTAAVWIRNNLNVLVKMDGERKVDGRRGKPSKLYAKLG